jgi:uncharacterized UBP type Zn finger protein
MTLGDRRVEGAEEKMSRCAHCDAIRSVYPRSSVCVSCLASGDSWLHLWMCLTCGMVCCSDDSRNRHALKHYEETDHPIVTSWEPDETWRWCYVDERHV